MSTTSSTENLEMAQQQTQINQEIQQISQVDVQQMPQEEIKVQKPRINTQTMKQYLSILSSGPQDTFDEISQDDIQYLERTKYKIALYPICTFLGLTALKKTVELVKIPEIFRNPLLPPKVNVQRGQYFKNFMSKNILLISCVVTTMGGFAVYEINKYYMYLKYKNLVESYLDACEREYLNNLKEQGQTVDLQLRSSTLPNQQQSTQQEE